MALQGTLDTVPLPDVLSLLASTSKCGRLAVTGSHEEGTLWVDGRLIVGARCRDQDGAVEVLATLLRFEEGAFRFDPGETPTGRRLAHPIDDALSEAAAYIAEWGEIEEVIPSPEHAIALRSVLEAPEVTLDRAAWHTLVHVGSGASAGALMARIGPSDIEAARALVSLVRAGLLDVIAPSSGEGRSTWIAVEQAPLSIEVPVSPPASSPAGEVPEDLGPMLDVGIDPQAPEDTEVGTGQPWREQVRHLLASAAPAPAQLGGMDRLAGAQPPLPPLLVTVPEASPIVAPPADGPAQEDDRNALLKFLGSVQR